MDEMEEVSRQFTKKLQKRDWKELKKRGEEGKKRRREKLRIQRPTKPLVTPDSGIGNITADDALIFEGNKRSVFGTQGKDLEGQLQGRLQN